MSWLLFIDESGHDHKQMPYEVRGGVAIHVSKLWPFIRATQKLELDMFGAELHFFGKELKGSTLLDEKRFRFAKQDALQPDEARRKNCRVFLERGLRKETPRRYEFTAYGQACVGMAQGIIELLYNHDAMLFAGAIPKGVKRSPAPATTEYLRKDQVFLFERFFYLLEQEREHGILVLDEVEKKSDRRVVQRLERYFTRTENGRYRAAWIVPSPFFVSSDMTYAVQAADLCIYCVNWGFRLPSQGMDARVRTDISDGFGPWMSRLQFRGEGEREGATFETYGIFYVPDPYTPRSA